jgi:hypothetical protein
MKKYSLLLCLTLVIGLLAATNHFVNSLQAQIGNPTPDRQVLVTMPPRTGEDGQIRIEPGEKYQTNIRVRNVSERTLTLRSFAQDFIVREDGETPIPVQDTVTNRWSLANWMVVAPNLHTLAPKETAEMSILIEVPENAMPGGKYAMVVHEPTDGTDLSDVQGAIAAISQRVGTLFYVIVEGPINEEAYIRNFKFKKFQEFGPVPYSFTVRNQSDVHIRPRMNIDIFNMLGKKSDSITVDSKNIFPLNSRDFAGKWDKIWGFGLYTAKLTASYGESGQVTVATANFWIVPVRIILSILFGGLLIAAIVMATKRYSEKKYQLEQEKVKELQKKLDQYEEEGKEKK